MLCRYRLLHLSLSLGQRSPCSAGRIWHPSISCDWSRDFTIISGMRADTLVVLLVCKREDVATSSCCGLAGWLNARTALPRLCSCHRSALFTHRCDSRPQSHNQQLQVLAKCSFYDYRSKSNKELKLYKLPPPTYNGGAPTYRFSVAAERQPPPPAMPPAMPPPPPHPATVAAERQPAARFYVRSRAAIASRSAARPPSKAKRTAQRAEARKRQPVSCQPAWHGRLHDCHGQLHDRRPCAISHTSQGYGPSQFCSPPRPRESTMRMCTLSVITHTFRHRRLMRIHLVLLHGMTVNAKTEILLYA